MKDFIKALVPTRLFRRESRGAHSPELAAGHQTGFSLAAAIDHAFSGLAHSMEIRPEPVKVPVRARPQVRPTLDGHGGR